jgi:hypothetical protein
VPILDTALAFALTMMVVATVVTTIVRALKNTAKLRNAVLNEMLKEYFHTEFKPVVERELSRLKKVLSQEAALQLNNKATHLRRNVPFSEPELTKLVTVTTDELTERLKRSEFGQELLSELGDKAQPVFDELAKRYEVIGSKYTESFRTSSRNWAIVVALALALLFNIDSIHIVDSYIRNEGMRQTVVAQRDAFEQDYNTLVASLDGADDSATVTKQQLEKSFSNSQDQLKVLADSGFPIGPTYFPLVCRQDGKAVECLQRNNPGGWALWVLGIVLTAGLAGLGAPFWFDAVRGLGRMVEGTRTNGSSQ